MRKALLERRNTRQGTRRDVGLGFDDAIYFDVRHSDDGNATIVCRDFGTGMDDYIVRNYLAVAGVSYYQSDDFRRQGLNMDPISRFGIGILSCFMVADRIEIETCREPQAGDPRQPLRIDVPAVDKQFRVYDGSPDSDIGTAVTVHVSGSKLKTDVRKEDVNKSIEPYRLRVTEYLCAIAGFVKSPIVINEDGRRTVILHPGRSESDAEAFKVDGVQFAIHQLSKERPWEKDFVPQDAHLARQHLTEVVLDLQNDLGLPEYEGTVSYLCYRSPDAKITRSSGMDNQNGIVISIGEESIFLRKEFLYEYKWGEKEGLCRSSQTNHALSIYRDGLLVADAAPPRRDDRIMMLSSMLTWPSPVLRVNLPKDVAGLPDVARRNLLGAAEAWDAPIWSKVARYLAEKEFPTALHGSPERRVESLSALAYYYHLTGDEMVDLIPAEKWPIPILMPAHGAQIADGLLSPGSRIVTTPKDLDSDIQNALGWGYQSYLRDYFQDKLRRWRGDVSIATLKTFIGRGLGMEPYWIELSRWYLAQMLRPVEIRFVTPSFAGLRPLTQVEYEVVARNKISDDEVVEKAMTDPATLNGAELSALHAMWWVREIDAIMEAVPFAAPFDSLFVSVDGRLNLLHPMTAKLIQFAAAIRWHKSKRSQNAADIGEAEDLLVAIAGSLHDPRQLNLQVQQLRDFLRLRGMINSGDSLPVVEAGDCMLVSKTSRLMERALNPKNETERIRFLEVTAQVTREFGFRVQEIEPEEAPEAVVKFITDWEAKH